MINDELLNIINDIDKNLDTKFSGLNLSNREKIMTHNIKLSEEVGELSKEILNYLGKQRNINYIDNNLSMELSDIIIVTLLISKSFDIDINIALKDKLNIIRQRGGI